jgi:ketosteroid isomerase-like protein
MKRVTALSLLVATVPAAGPLSAQSTAADLQRQVIAAESSFAATLAHRDVNAFAALVAPDAVFFGERGSLRGKAAVVEGWRPLFAGPKAPFSWKPEVVEVLASGTLAWSSGPVQDSTGRAIGTFNSVWRREPDGRWLVILDKGCPVCDCARGP